MKENIDKICEEGLFSFISSFSFAVLIPETLHLFSVIISTFIGTIVIHYTNKFLNRKKNVK